MFARPSRPVDRIFIHCSASDAAAHDNIATMRKWHTDPRPKGRGWSDVGYHYFIRKDGTLEAGRPLDRIPAAQAGQNTGTIAICLHGLRVERFNETQFTTLRMLCSAINKAYAGKVTFHGHCEVSAKSCPVFDYKAVLGLDRYGYLGGEALVAHSDAGAPLLRYGARGPSVERAQALLNISADGVFGPLTTRAVKAFQKKAGLAVDGVVGPNTWKALLA